jgi:AcrR family transcriptional regulator
VSADATRERILEASGPIFAREGFAGASTRALALAAGVNIATLAYHFGDKQGLYDALVDRTYGRMLEVELDAGPGDRAEQLRSLVRGLYRFARAHQVELRVLLRHVLDSRTLPPSVRERWLAPLLAKVGSALAPLGIPLDPPRLTSLLSLNHLLVRYAISDPGDLALFAADGDPDTWVEAHLGDVAVRLLLER